MNDCFISIFSLLDVEGILSLRITCKRTCDIFLEALPYITKEKDLHPCRNLKEFITAFAHRNRLWRRVRSFSFLQNFCFALLAKGEWLVKNYFDPSLYGMAVVILAPHKQKEIKLQDPLFSLLSEKYESMQENLNRDFSLLGYDEIKGLFYLAVYTGSHMLFEKLFRVIKNKCSTLKIDCFRILAEHGVSPYYLKKFAFCGNILKALNSRSYMSLICSNANQYLLKQKLIKDKSGYVDKNWKWQRGRDICKKYKEKKHLLDPDKLY